MSDPFAAATLATRVAQQCRVRALKHLEPTIVEGSGVMIDPDGVLVLFQEAQSALAEALGAMAKIRWPTPADYEQASRAIAEARARRAS